MVSDVAASPCFSFSRLIFSHCFSMDRLRIWKMYLEKKLCSCYQIDVSCWIVSGVSWREHVERCEQCVMAFAGHICPEHGRKGTEDWKGIVGWRKDLELSSVVFRVERSGEVSGSVEAYWDGPGHEELPWMACVDEECNVHRGEKVQCDVLPQLKLVRRRRDEEMKESWADAMDAMYGMDAMDAMEIDSVDMGG